jgi:hypothetical protein
MGLHIILRKCEEEKMANLNKKSGNKKNHKKAMGKKEKFFMGFAVVVLVLAIILVSIFLLYPKLAGRPDWQVKISLDFKDSDWVQEMVSRRIEPTQKVIDITSSFVYSTETAFLSYTYGSTANIEDAAAHYLAQIPGSVDRKADDVSNMNVAGTLNGEKVDIVNYEAELLNAYDIKVTIDDDIAEFIKTKLIYEFPDDFLNTFPEIALIRNNEKLGGYVMYNDDDLSSNSYVGVPIFSEAYRYSGPKEELIAIQIALSEKYNESVYFEKGEMVYFKDRGYIISLVITESDLNLLAVITVQKIPDDALTDE